MTSAEVDNGGDSDDDDGPKTNRNGQEIEIPEVVARCMSFQSEGYLVAGRTVYNQSTGYLVG